MAMTPKPTAAEALEEVLARLREALDVRLLWNEKIVPFGAVEVERMIATLRAALLPKAGEVEKLARDFEEWAQDARDHGSPRVPIAPITLERAARLLRATQSNPVYRGGHEEHEEDMK